MKMSFICNTGPGSKLAADESYGQDTNFDHTLIHGHLSSWIMDNRFIMY